MIYFKLFLEFFKIGLFTFGGGYAMIPLIREVVIKYQWMAETEFYNFIGICESTPGPIAINMATFIGNLQGGILGAVVATLGVVLAPFLIILLIASVLKRFLENRLVKGFMKGVKPVIIGLILATGIIMIAKAIGYQSLKQWEFSLESVIIIAILVIGLLISKYLLKKKVNAILFIVIAAGVGIIVSVISKAF